MFSQTVSASQPQRICASSELFTTSFLLKFISNNFSSASFNPNLASFLIFFLPSFTSEDSLFVDFWDSFLTFLFSSQSTNTSSLGSNNWYSPFLSCTTTLSGCGLSPTLLTTLPNTSPFSSLYSASTSSSPVLIGVNCGCSCSGS